MVSRLYFIFTLYAFMQENKKNRIEGKAFFLLFYTLNGCLENNDFRLKKGDQHSVVWDAPRLLL